MEITWKSQTPLISTRLLKDQIGDYSISPHVCHAPASCLSLTSSPKFHAYAACCFQIRVPQSHPPPFPPKLQAYPAQGSFPNQTGRACFERRTPTKVSSHFSPGVILPACPFSRTHSSVMEEKGAADLMEVAVLPWDRVNDRSHASKVLQKEREKEEPRQGPRVRLGKYVARKATLTMKLLVHYKTTTSCMRRQHRQVRGKTASAPRRPRIATSTRLPRFLHLAAPSRRPVC